MVDYFVIEKEKSDFQKLLNQWKRLFKIEVIWMYYNKVENKYHALIKREANHDKN